ncbi:MAG: DNA replication and repair protein RecF [Candidatus Zixiibacteriota bacterium]|nr:MAG: DNA replication and repair protein RecF [candidate division Zixibacteria bacterium]
MYLESLSALNFRNLRSIDSKLVPGVNIFYGNNGSGKTNLLEAIFVLCLGRSHRSAAEAVLIHRGSEYYRLEGQVYIDDRSLALAVAYQRGMRKKVTVDKVQVKLSELYSRFAVVAAGPEDSNILSGAPSMRRSFLDVYLSQYSSSYLSQLMSYQKVLNQKNAALKRRMDATPFNELLVQSGAAIMQDRLDYLANLGKLATGYYQAVSGGGEFELEYRPSVKLPAGLSGYDDIAAVFANTLGEYEEREKVMEASLVGVHRDDVAFSINGLPARSHGSQGEWRTAAVALKLAVYHLIRERRSIRPVLLLDEIFAELDSDRSEALTAAFEDFEQLFISTAAELPRFLSAGSRRYKMVDGAIVEIN